MKLNFPDCWIVCTVKNYIRFSIVFIILNSKWGTILMLHQNFKFCKSVVCLHKPQLSYWKFTKINYILLEVTKSIFTALLNCYLHTAALLAARHFPEKKPMCSMLLKNYNLKLKHVTYLFSWYALVRKCFL